MKLDITLRETALRIEKREAEGWAEKERQIIEACHPKQRAFVLDPGRRVVALVGRGGGKTTGVRARLMLRMMRTRKARCLFIATTRDQAVELLWDPIKDICARLNISAKFNETKLTCKFLDTGSVVRLVGADDKRQIEKYRGIPYHEVWVDEAASYPAALLENLIDRVIGPRLGDFGGMLGLVGTPGHILSGVFYDATRPGSPDHRPYEERDKPEYADWVKWSRHAWTVKDGAEHVPALQRVWEEALIQKRAKGWGDKHPVWLRESMGQWAADDSSHVFQYRPHDDEGKQWNQWDPAIDPVTRFAKLPADLIEPLFVYSADFGHTDPTAINVFAYSMRDPKHRLIHCYSFNRREMYISAIADLLVGPAKGRDLANPGGLIGVTGWPAGFVADPRGLAGGYIDEFKNIHGIRMTLASQREKFGSIELTNGDLIDGRIWIMKGSPLEEQLLNLQWVVDDFGKVKEDPRQRNDATDTLIYARREAQHLLTMGEPEKDPGSPYSRDTFAGNIKGDGQIDSSLDVGGFDDFWG